MFEHLVNVPLRRNAICLTLGILLKDDGSHTLIDVKSSKINTRGQPNSFLSTRRPSALYYLLLTLCQIVATFVPVVNAKSGFFFLRDHTLLSLTSAVGPITVVTAGVAESGRALLLDNCFDGLSASRRHSRITCVGVSFYSC